MKLRTLCNVFLNILFPPHCLGCKKQTKDRVLCETCENSIETFSAFFCPMCRRRLPEPRNTCHPQAKFVLAAASSYQNEVVRELVHVFKYQRIKSALAPLREIINQYLSKTFKNQIIKTASFIIVPIPLNVSKEKERGFNQALLVSEVLSKMLCYSITPEPRIEINNLVRVKKTKSQTEVKSYEERKRNVSGAFALKQPEAVAGKNIILVDDVFTSGATMREAVRVLKQAGAKKIIGFVIAKT